MTDKSSLLRQLKLDRPPPAPKTGGARWWLLGAAIVLLAAATGAWYLYAGSGAVAVHVATARAAATSGDPSAPPSLLDASGYVVARRQATVSAKITGKVTQLLIEEGQHVAADQVIARIDDSNTMAALEQARAQVAQAAAGLEAARIAFADAEPIYRRQQKLTEQGWVSHDALDAAKSTYDVAQSNLAVAERTLKSAEAGLVVAQRNQDDTTVRAPFDGVVTVKAAQEGEIVSPFSAGGGFTRTGIGTIVDMDSLEVEVDVSENFIHRVHPDQAATVKLNAYPDWAIPAAVIAVIPTADRSKATVKVRVGFKVKDPRILPEMGARVAFLGEAPAAGARPVAGVIVPAAAVHADGDTGSVLLVDGDRVERRAVRLGARTEQGQTILAGLAEGDRVVAGDVPGLAEGARIRIETEEPK